MTGDQDTSASADPGAVLAVFRRALARETHVLRRHPDLLWQQLYNRLQWEDEPVRAVLAPVIATREARRRDDVRTAGEEGTVGGPRTKWLFTSAKQPRNVTPPAAGEASLSRCGTATSTA